MRFILNKLNNTIWFSVWILTAAIFFSGAVGLIINKPFLYVFSMVFIGMCGSTYEATLEKNSNSNIIGVYLI
jgi:hypothetical protein